ncbi:hypothetical protein T3H00_01560 [Pseudomonas fluorescens]|uniref:hypothetical protein n=1 Tax=Pseudomonas fluorescens TaxID=294 RepID=UPI002ACAD55E|nr:hypothetical protein [Pseudomonas fluorescens]MDZ5431353.1 hypothetical protein [Pseudomonas fluorescens]
MLTATPAARNLAKAKSHSVLFEWLWLLPFAAALYYPWALSWSNQAHLAGAGSLVTVALLLTAYAVPTIAFICVYLTGAQPVITGRLVLARRLACLAVAAPPAYTLLGVLLYLMKIYGHDMAVWTGLWLALTGYFAMHSSTITVASLPTSDIAYRRLRVAHGISSLLIMLVFLAPHLFNHLIGVFGADFHRTVMDVLRVLYRNAVLEPIIIVAFFFQILSGLVLIRPKTISRADLLDSLQTASGAYLTLFIASHINSVFTLARYFGTETDYKWAVGDPVGLVADAWNIRLLPHYSLAVFFLIAHLACGMRVVMRNHNVRPGVYTMSTWGVIMLDGLVTAVITAGMIGARF